MKTNIEISARHLHLTKEDYHKLFKKDDLTVRNQLNSDKEMFAAKETVELVGPGGRLLNVRIIGPFRNYSQVEIAKTDARLLDIDAPLILSGSGSGANIRVLGPRGEIIKNIAIIAKRHLHLSLKLSSKYNLRQGSKIKVAIAGERGLIFDNIIVRVSSEFNNHLHFDTDEGNAAGINKQAMGEILTNQR